MYHRMGRAPKGAMVPGHYTTPNRFRRQLAWLRASGYATVSSLTAARGLAGTSLPPKPLVITFDDGYTTFHEHAVPALQAAGMSATVYVVAGLLGGTNEWDERLGDAREALMTDAQVLACARAGIEVGSHTLSHPHLPQLADQLLRQELVGSRERIGELLGEAPYAFCYPYGDHDHRVVQAVRDAGYQVATTTQFGANAPGIDPLRLRRINVRSNTTLPYLAYKLFKARLRARRPC